MKLEVPGAAFQLGRIAPQEGMDYIATVPGVDGIVVGIGTPAEAEETFRVAAEALGRQSGL